MKFKIKKPSKKLWLIFILFLFTFCFGDIISTLIVLQIPETTPQYIKEACVCKLPPECELNPIVAKSPSLRTIFGLKIIIALIGLWLLLFVGSKWTGYTLLVLSFFGFFAILSNLTIHYWQIAPFLFYPMAIAMIFILAYFTNPKWQQKKNLSKKKK